MFSYLASLPLQELGFLQTTFMKYLEDPVNKINNVKSLKLSLDKV